MGRGQVDSSGEAALADRRWAKGGRQKRKGRKGRQGGNKESETVGERMGKEGSGGVKLRRMEAGGRAGGGEEGRSHSTGSREL